MNFLEAETVLLLMEIDVGYAHVAMIDFTRGNTKRGVSMIEAYLKRGTMRRGVPTETILTKKTPLVLECEAFQEKWKKMVESGGGYRNIKRQRRKMENAITDSTWR